MASVSARRYAQAVIEIARENGTFDAWQQDLAVLSQLIEDPEVERFLSHPGIPAADKFKVVDAALRDIQPEARNLLHLLITRHRLSVLPDLVRLFDEAVKAAKGVVVVDVTTADALDDAGKELVREHLRRIVGKDVELRLQVDPAIIGGIVARIGDQVIDGSVVNQLRRLRARLVAA